tara:strand:+ start:2251 stop:3054 length:804 start_codon:yes stop_codon:yes gene_type:complete
MINIEENRKYLFFIGSGRTGSTLLGQLINYHPFCLISNESRFLQNCIDNNISPDESMRSMIFQAVHEFEKGLEKSSTHGKNIDKYQKDWIDMGDLSNLDQFKKKNIKIVGDKKAGGNASVFRKNPNRFCSFIDFLGRDSVYFIQIIRNPIDSIFSYTKSHGYSVEDAATRVIQDTQSGIDISKIFPNYLMCRYDNLLKNPGSTLEDIFSFLGETCDKRWLEEISKKISKKSQYRKDEVLDISSNKSIMDDIGSIECFNEILNDREKS